MKLISLYTSNYHSGTDFLGQRAPEAYDIEVILNSIKDGLYEERYPLKDIRLAKSNFRIEEERVFGLGLSKEEIAKDEKYQKAYEIVTSLKDKIPRVTISGLFKPEGRKEANLKEHSGFIDIDIDKLDEEELINVKEKLKEDKYTYSVFTTCGGDGLSLIFHIDGTKHSESWDGIAEYLFKNYGISLDKAHKNPANTRNISYDPDLYLASKIPQIFKPEKKAKKKEVKEVNFIYAKCDFESCIKQIIGQQLDFCPNYETYRDIGFAIANKFGIAGLDYFNAVCQYGEKYNEPKLIKHYKYLCRNPEGKVKIATFFYRCKELNLEIYSKETKTIASVASAAYKSGRTKEDVINNLKEHDNLGPELTTEIVNQVFDEKIEFFSTAGILDDIESYIKYNYSLKKNLITGKFENYGVEWSEEDFNSCLIDIKKVFDKSDAKWIERILFSRSIPSYNPIFQFFEDNKSLMPKIVFVEGRPQIPKIIQDLWDSVRTRSVHYTTKYGTKWLVGAVSTWMLDESSNLELIFAGALEKGKTHFIRHLLPESIKRYYAEANIDGSNDSNVMMCQKLIINQNECGGKSKLDDKIHKDLLDKEYFTLRRPYRRDNEDMKRIAAPFGTTNTISNVITDRLGNRRIIVTEVLSRDRDAYDKIDKTELWMAVYALYKAGYEWKILGEEIKELNHYSKDFENHGLEYELICKYFDRCEKDDKDNLKLSSSEIKVHIESKTLQKLNLKLIIEELYRMNFVLESVVKNGLNMKAYNIKLAVEPIFSEEVKDLPF